MTSRAPQILTICTGNVCRSPYLERRLQQELDRLWGAGVVQVRSAGTGALVGAPMDPDSLARLRAHGGEGDDFAARQVSSQIIEPHHLVLVASRDHRKAVTRLHPKSLARTHALLDAAQLAQQVSEAELRALPAEPLAHLEAAAKLLASKRGLVLPLSPELAEVHDPFGQDGAAFDLMQTQIEDALPPVLRVLGPAD